MEDVTWFNDMMDAAENHYVNGKPRHISDPSTSVFKVLTKDEFEDMEDREIQSILLRQHILITKGKKPKYGFDLDGLETLAPLDKPIIIHGEYLAYFIMCTSYHASHGQTYPCLLRMITMCDTRREHFWICIQHLSQ